MMEISSLEAVLLLANVVLLFLYNKEHNRAKQHHFAMAAILHGLHENKLRIVQEGESLKVELK